MVCGDALAALGIRRICSGGHDGDFRAEVGQPAVGIGGFPPTAEPDRILAAVHLVVERLGEIDRQELEVTSDSMSSGASALDSTLVAAFSNAMGAPLLARSLASPRLLSRRACLRLAQAATRR